MLLSTVGVADLAAEGSLLAKSHFARLVAAALSGVQATALGRSNAFAVRALCAGT